MQNYNMSNLPNIAVGGHPGQCSKRTSERYGKLQFGIHILVPLNQN